MNIDEHMLDWVLADMRKGFPHGIERHGSVFSTGLTMSSGRAVGVIVEPTLSVIRVTDGGDAWSDLVMDGYADPRPTLPEREKLQRACELHGVGWEAERREIVGIARAPEDVARIATCVAATAIAIDGWRAWYPPRQTRNVHRKRIVDHISRLAPVRGWAVDTTSMLQGTVHTWSADATLARGTKHAAIEITAERNGEHIMQRIVGFLYDVRNVGLVVVVPKSAQEYIQGSAELRERVVVVPRMWKGTPRAVIDAAERAAVAA